MRTMLSALQSAGQLDAEDWFECITRSVWMGGLNGKHWPRETEHRTPQTV